MSVMELKILFSVNNSFINIHRGFYNYLKVFN